MPPAAFLVPVPPGPPRPLRWTVEQFHALGDLGCFEGRRAWLLDGVIIEGGPMNPPHRIALELTDGALRAVFGAGWRVCVQMPLVVGPGNDPEPDVAVVAGSPRGTTGHPTTAALVVEVADSSLTDDVTVKAAKYATAGIPDYWVVDVDGRRLLVFRDPAPVPGGGAAYRTKLAFAPPDAVAPLAAPANPVPVADLLP